MKTKTLHWLFTVITAFVAVAFIATSSHAETATSTDEGYNGHMMQPGMHGGMMGPGQMGYRGMGPGTGYGMMGPGYMHRGHGMGFGMGHGGMWMMQALDLDKSQRSKLRALMHEQRAVNCKTMTQMMDVRDELETEYDKDKPDAKVIGKLYEKMQAMQRHMLERHVDMRNKVRAMLNKEQKEIFDRMHHGGMGFGYGMGMMGGGMGFGMGHGGMMNMMP